MKNLLFLLFFGTCATTHIWGQDATATEKTTPGQWITINLDMTDSMTRKNLGFDITSKLETKVLNIIARNGKGSKVSCVKKAGFDPENIDIRDLAAGIVCKPKMEIFDEDFINTGMEKMATAKISVSIYIMSIRGNVVFASITKDYMGTGKDRAAAINNAITNITAKDSDYEPFLKNARDEIVRYYDQMCGTIVQQARDLARLRLYLDAIFLLWPIPQEVKCHAEARDSMVKIYKEYVEFRCKDNILTAKSYMSGGDFAKALSALRNIDPEASCAPEAINMMNQIASKVDEKEKQTIAQYNKAMEDVKELEKERYRAMSNMTQTYNYSKTEVDVTKKN